MPRIAGRGKAARPMTQPDSPETVRKERLVVALIAAVLLVALARSALACWHAGGIHWRGTFYPVAALRAGARLRL